ncbi:MAG: hypothetical protein OIN88_11955 [Candidatus Methanoperedens sp.]|nr:hypothetical protein [Candidatus Methanoperedens sp.]MCZ7358613.1 hypothetical protein [Candidatus Methanoperedens sp.]
MPRIPPARRFISTELPGKKLCTVITAILAAKVNKIILATRRTSVSVIIYGLDCALKVDIVTEKGLRPRIRDHVLKDTLRP